MSHVGSASPVTHVSLCAGYGGIDLGLHRAIRNLRTIAVSEIEAFACANLVAKMEAGLLDCAPIWTDLKTFPWSDFRDRVDILSGGYPCQPFSTAGKRLGKEDPRHLWPHISAGIALMRPRVCFFENVEGHISLGLPDVIEDLVGLGYRPTWCVASASECGAPHQRKRVFILAYRTGEGLERYAGNGDAIYQPGRIGQESDGHAGTSGLPAWPSRPGEPQHEWEPPRVVGNGDAAARENRGSSVCGGDKEAVADTNNAGWETKRYNSVPSEGRESHKPSARKSNIGESEAVGNAMHRSNGRHTSEQQGRHSVGRSGEEGAVGNGQTQQPVGDPAYGTPDGLGVAELSGLSDQQLAEIRHWMVARDNRTDELRLLGNGVVPACAERAFRLLVSELMEHQP